MVAAATVTPPPGPGNSKSGKGGGVPGPPKPKTAAQIKATKEWQAGLWQKWPEENLWPVKMDVYEAAAYMWVSPDSIYSDLVQGRDGKAALQHQRVRGGYRIKRADLDVHGLVKGR